MTNHGKSLLDKYPELAKEADGWDPRLVSANSGKRLNWKCPKGHRWNAIVNNRTKGRGCPVCAGKEVIPGFNDLATTHPELAKEADGWDPTTLRPGSNKMAPWKCTFGHRWTSTVNNRTSGRGCPVCAGKEVVPGFNDLATTHPELAKEADGWDPATLSRGSRKKVNWLCREGHVFIATVANRTGANKTGCGICNGKVVQKGINDLATLYPELAEEAIGWDPATVSQFSGKKRQWKCSLGHVWTAVVSSRANGSGCPVCAGKEVVPGFNDLATTHPELAKEADGWDPATLSRGAHTVKAWRCTSGHTFHASPHSRSGANMTGCPICAGQQILVGFNDLATTHPELADQADGWDPKTVISGSNKPVPWRCTLGHQWSTSPHNRTGNAKSGCPVCANKKVLKGFNDLATKDPELAEQAFEWDPHTVTRSSRKKQKWQCQFGHIWSATPADRTNGNGCPTCSKGGFDPNREAWFYFIGHDEWKMYQIGITNNPDLRLKSHNRLGWELIEIRGPLDGHYVQELETSALRSIKRRQALFASKAGGSPFDGWTEAWLRSSLPLATISQLLEWIYEDEI